MFQVHVQLGGGGFILAHYWTNTHSLWLEPSICKVLRKTSLPFSTATSDAQNSNKDLSSELQYCHLYIVNSNVNVAQSLQKIESDNIDFPFIKRQF